MAHLRFTSAHSLARDAAGLVGAILNIQALDKAKVLGQRVLRALANPVGLGNPAS